MRLGLYLPAFQIISPSPYITLLGWGIPIEYTELTSATALSASAPHLSHTGSDSLLSLCSNFGQTYIGFLLSSYPKIDELQENSNFKEALELCKTNYDPNNVEIL